ncbi:MAG: hypothetical protein JWP92_1182 [Caulobacter sp.]|nr:hypothetical protein [Caulobacter sp.]
MTHNAQAPSRKPRRRGLIWPFVLLLILAVAWSIGWLWLRVQAERRMDATALALKAGGYEMSWKGRTFTGYPFRLDASFTEVRLAEPSGWALAAPALDAEAMIYGLDHWVLVAPRGVVLTRPIGGPVTISGQALRASLAGFKAYPPRISIEGANLTFIPGPGAAPFPLLSAEGLQLHLRPGPDDQAAILFRADNARASFSGLLGRIAQDKPASLLWDARLTKVSGLKSGSWADAVRGWSQAGGAITVQEGKLTAGDALLEARSGALTVGDDGRLQGKLDVTLKEAPKLSDIKTPEQALAALAAATGQDPSIRAGLVFQNGRTSLGPLDTGPSPRIY